MSQGTFVTLSNFPRGHIGSIIRCSIKWPPGVSVSSLPFDGNTILSLSLLNEICCKNDQLKKKKSPVSGRLSAQKRQQSNASVNQLANEQENINSQLAEQSQHASVWIKHAFGVFSSVCWSEVDYPCGLFPFCLNISTVVAMANHSPVFQLIISVWTRSAQSQHVRAGQAGQGGLLASTKLLQPQGHRPNRGPEVIGANTAVICSITSKLIGRKRGCLSQGNDGKAPRRASWPLTTIYVAFVLSMAKLGHHHQLLSWPIMTWKSR